MDSLRTTLETTMRGYTGRGANGAGYLTISPDADLFSVLVIAQVQGQRFVETGLVARLMDDLIVIERDVNNKPLVDALVQAGIPREHIILAYQGESVPELA